MEKTLVQNEDGKNLSMTVNGVTIKVGDRVLRGPDWGWGNQDKDSVGTVVGVDVADCGAWVNVEWDAGESNHYRWGEDDKFDLRIVTKTEEAASKWDKVTTTKIFWNGSWWGLQCADGDLNLMRDDDASPAAWFVAHDDGSIQLHGMSVRAVLN